MRHLAQSNAHRQQAGGGRGGPGAADAQMECFMGTELWFGKMKVLELGWAWLHHGVNVLHATAPCM